MTETSVLKQKNGSIDYEAYKGMEGTIDVNGMRVNVIVTDARVCYGRFDLCVEPRSGVGFRWVDYRNVQLNGAPTPTVAPVLSFTETLNRIREQNSAKTK